MAGSTLVPTPPQPSRQKWEYLSVHAELKETRYMSREWVADIPGGMTLSSRTTLTGLNVIMDHYGNLGWELVNSVPAFWYNIGNAKNVSQQLTEIELFFKRPKL